MFEFYCVHRLACKWMTYWWGRDIVLEFFKTGKYEWLILTHFVNTSISLFLIGKLHCLLVEQSIPLMKRVKGFHWTGGGSTIIQGLLNTTLDPHEL